MKDTNPNPPVMTNSWKRRALLALGVGALAALVGFSTYAYASPHTASASEAVAGRTTVAIEIPEVSCAGCSLTARRAVKAAGGVIRLGEGDPKNQLMVTYEPGPGRPEVYVQALQKAGFAKAQKVARR